MASIFETLKKYGKSKNNAIAEAIKDFVRFKTSGYIQSELPSSGNIEVAIQALQAQAKRRWIPVSERLPEERGEYLVAYYPCCWGEVYDEVYVGIDSFRGKTAWAKKKYQRVTHWMPLPEPPKE